MFAARVVSHLIKLRSWRDLITGPSTSGGRISVDAIDSSAVIDVVSLTNALFYVLAV